MRPWGALVLAALAFAAGACQRADSRRGGKPLVAVTIPPQAYFVERLAAEWVDVQITMPPGTNPHTYEPTIEQARTMSEAAVYVEVGHPKLPFERGWIERLLDENENVELVDCSQGVAVDGEDPHLWTSPAAVRTMVPRIAAALADLLPAHAAEIGKRKNELLSDIEKLDAELRASFASPAKRRFYVFHPGWGYFARDYGLEQVAIEEEGKEPDPARLARLIERAKQDGVKVIFVAPQFSRRSAELVAGEIGARLVLLDSLAADWLATMRTAGREIREALT
jgi:zinc transport system substrate-binding protein